MENGPVRSTIPLMLKIKNREWALRDNPFKQSVEEEMKNGGMALFFPIPTACASQVLTHRRECEPSQNGLVCECLQAHQATVFSSVICTWCGASPVPLCEPSQKGWLFERPHAHHQYVPGNAFCTRGDF